MLAKLKLAGVRRVTSVSDVRIKSGNGKHIIQFVRGKRKDILRHKTYFCMLEFIQIFRLLKLWGLNMIGTCRIPAGSHVQINLAEAIYRTFL